MTSFPSRKFALGSATRPHGCHSFGTGCSSPACPALPCPSFLHMSQVVIWNSVWCCCSLKQPGGTEESQSTHLRREPGWASSSLLSPKSTTSGPLLILPVQMTHLLKLLQHLSRKGPCGLPDTAIPPHCPDWSLLNPSPLRSCTRVFNWKKHQSPLQQLTGH